MFRYLRGLALLAALGCVSPALATTCAPGASCSLTQGSWTDLGAGPLQVNNTGLFQAQLAVSTDSTLAAAPTGPATTYLGPGGVSYFTTAAHVWAQASGPTGATILASVMAVPTTQVSIVNPRSVTPDTNLNDFHATNLGVAQLNTGNGVPATGVAQPTGGSGTWGWLSGIYQKLAGTLSASISGNLPDTAAGDVAAIRSNTNNGAAATGVSQPTGGSGTWGWLSGIYNALISRGTAASPLSVADGSRIALGTYPISVTTAVSLATAIGTAMPTGATRADIQPQTGNLMMREDGTAPTTSVGILISSTVSWPTTASLSQIQIASQSGAAVTGVVSFYK
jgi:hypothetical protein